MKRLKWELKTVSLDYGPRSGSTAPHFEASVMMFRRRARVTVSSRYGRFTQTCRHSCFPLSWEDFFQLYDRFRVFVVDGPALWTKVVHHPKGLGLSLSESLFKPHIVGLPFEVADDLCFSYRLLFGVKLVVSKHVIKGDLRIHHDLSYDLIKLTWFSVPPIVAVLCLARLGYCFKVTQRGREQGTIQSLSDILSLKYVPECELWVCSETFTPCYVPVMQLTRKNLEGLRCLIECEE
ncbi:hypothetical protein DRO59_01010 [Candidatus Bathyarchaeota archaeon]|nr:MAG: hypothetical protein DRO59_01010 [Candidatus Bathyarchaeota archaeon]